MYLFEETIRETIEEGKIGVPVFVRWLVCDRAAEAVEQLARMILIAESWLASGCLRLAGSVTLGAWTLSGLCEGGQSFLLGYAQADSGKARRSDLMLLGNRGALYYDDLPVVLPPIPDADRSRHRFYAERIEPLSLEGPRVVDLLIGRGNHE